MNPLLISANTYTFQLVDDTLMVNVTIGEISRFAFFFFSSVSLTAIVFTTSLRLRVGAVT